MDKEILIRAHEELVEQYLESHPSATWDQAYERTACRAHERARDYFMEAIDEARMRVKDGL